LKPRQQNCASKLHSLAPQVTFPGFDALPLELPSTPPSAGAPASSDVPLDPLLLLGPLLLLPFDPLLAVEPSGPGCAVTSLACAPPHPPRAVVRPHANSADTPMMKERRFIPAPLSMDSALGRGDRPAFSERARRWSR